MPSGPSGVPDHDKPTASKADPRQQPTATYPGSAWASAVPVAMPTHVGRYEIASELGSGAFGSVYKAWDPLVGRFVAIKVPRRGLLESENEVNRFLAESKRAGQLKHPGIVTVYDVVREGATCCIVSEFIEGPTLEERLRRGPIAENEAIALIAELADILNVAHHHHLVHRDVKPSNVLVDSAGRLHLTDFGVAASLEELRDTRQASSGTPAYMAPEVVPNPNAPSSDLPGPDHRVDIYALGVVFYRMLTGRMPFEAPEISELFALIHKGTPLPPRLLKSELSSDVEEICLKAMARHPGERYRTARDLAAALRNLTDKTAVIPQTAPARRAQLAPPVQAPAPPIVTVPSRLGARKPPGLKHPNRNIWIAVSVVGVAVIALIIWLATRSNNDGDSVAKNKEDPSSRSTTPIPGKKIKVIDPGTARLEQMMIQMRSEIEGLRKELRDRDQPKADPPPKKLPESLSEVTLPERFDKQREQIATVRAQGNDDEEFKLLLELSNDLMQAHEWIGMYAAAKRLVELSKPDKSGVTIANSQLGLAQFGMGLTREALATYQVCLMDSRKYYALLERAPDTPENRKFLSHTARMLGLTLTRIGNVHKAREEYEQAETVYLEGENLLQRHNRKSELTTLLLNLGSLYSLRGKHEKALTTFERVAKLAEDSNDIDDAFSIYNNWGNAYSRNRQEKKALEAYRKAHKLIGPSTTYDAHCKLLANWLMSALEEGEFAEAEVVGGELRRLARPNDARSQKVLAILEEVPKELRSGKKKA